MCWQAVSGPMPSRTVNLSNEAYELLASRKADRESFSDVVKRLAGERSLFEIVGVLDEAQARRLHERVEAGRERARRRRKRQLSAGRIRGHDAGGPGG